MSQTTFGLTNQVEPEEDTKKEASPKKGSDTRQYHVFFQTDSEDLYRLIGTIEATSPENALKALVKDPAEAVGKKFAACPVRNWSPLEPKLRPESLSF